MGSDGGGGLRTGFVGLVALGVDALGVVMVVIVLIVNRITGYGDSRGNIVGDSAAVVGF